MMPNPPIDPSMIIGDGMYVLALLAIEGGVDTSYFDGREAVSEPALFVDVR